MNNIIINIYKLFFIFIYRSSLYRLWITHIFKDFDNKTCAYKKYTGFIRDLLYQNLNKQNI